MKSQPHYLVSRYERLILRPLDFLYYALALYFFWHRAWLFGAGIILLSFVIGAIGQGLPHRKHETPAEMAEGLQPFAGEFEGDISLGEASGVGKAVFLTSLLITFTGFIVAWHQGLRWYWLLLTVIFIGPLFALCSTLIAIGPGKLLALSRSKRSA